MNKKYWKVHKNNFNSFASYLRKKYKKFSNITMIEDFINYYDKVDSKYLYLYIEDGIELNKYHLTYNSILDSSEDDDYYEYMGEFNNRKDKLNKLKDINN